MKTKILYYTICIFVIVLIQSTVLDYITIYNTKPNLLIVFVISVALLMGNLEGAVIGFFAGWAQDIVSGRILGFYALMGLYLGLIVGSVNKRLYRENFLVAIFFTFISTIIYEGVVIYSTMFLTDYAEILFAFKNKILPEAIYNSFASIFIYTLVIRLSYKFEGTGKISRKY